MNRDDIIRMANESNLLGIYADEAIDSVIRFAALVASAEREVCAKLLEEAAEEAKFVDPQGFVWQAVYGSAEFIRARGEA